MISTLKSGKLMLTNNLENILLKTKLYHLFFHRNRHWHCSDPLEKRKHSTNENQWEFL